MILLDSHVALWVDQDPDRIGPHARARLAAGDVVCFSAVLTIEATIKRMLGRWPGPEDLASRLVDAGLSDLPLTTRHSAAQARFPDLARHDPFDRLYVAQSFVEQASLFTADRRLLAMDHDWIVDARS